MNQALCLRVQGPGEADVLAALERFFRDHGALELRPLDLGPAPTANTKGLAEQRERVYAILCGARDWAAAVATVGAFVWLFVPPAPAPPDAAATSQVAVQVEQVKAVKELLAEIGKLSADHDFTLELVDPASGAFLRLDKQAAPADVVAFCRAHPPEPPR